MIKSLLLAAILGISAPAFAQVSIMGGRDIKGVHYYTQIFSVPGGRATEWAVNWAGNKTLALYNLEKGKPKIMASYELSPKFYHIESGTYLLRIAGLDRPLFIFVLNHGAPVSTLYLIDPKQTSKPLYTADIPTDEFEISVQDKSIHVVYADAVKHQRRRLRIDTAKMGIK